MTHPDAVTFALGHIRASTGLAPDRDSFVSPTLALTSAGEKARSPILTRTASLDNVASLLKICTRQKQCCGQVSRSKMMHVERLRCNETPNLCASPTFNLRGPEKIPPITACVVSFHRIMDDIQCSE